MRRPLRISFALSFLLQWAVAVPYIVKIAPYDEECFLIRTPKDKSLRLFTGDFELIEEEGGISAEPLLVYIMEADAKEKILWRSSGKHANTFRIGVKGGNAGYWFCIQNSSHAPDAKHDEKEHPDHRLRMVGFSFELTTFEEQKPAPAIFTKDHHYDWMEKSQLVHEELNALVHHHDYLRMRESQHRSVVEHTFSSVLFWTVVEAALVVIMAVSQIMYFRNFLEKKRSYMM